jgi:hypothetical protein
LKIRVSLVRFRDRPPSFYKVRFYNLIGFKTALCGPLAQLVEQRIENPRVLGSIPRRATSIKRTAPMQIGAVFHFPRHFALSSPDLFVVIACGINGDYAIMFASCNTCHCTAN